MLLSIMAALILATQTPAANSLISDAPTRNRRMTYGKSKVAYQPFLSKPLACQTADNTGESSSSSALEGINNLKIAENKALSKEAKSNNLKALTNARQQLSAQQKQPQPPPSLNQQQEQQQQATAPAQQQPSQPKAPLANRSWQKPKPSSGLANIYWRAVDVEDLRTHPFFDSLPLPDDVFAREESEYSLFRQDSWQWGALHAGRLTTARAAACLGFYEQDSARVLKVPRSLSGHSKAVHAYEHLQEDPPESWSFLNQDYLIKYPERIEEVREMLIAGKGDNGENGEGRSGENSESNGKGKKKRGGYQQRPDEKANMRQNQINVKNATKAPGVWFPVKELSKNNTAARSSFPYAYRPKSKHSGERGYSSASSARMAWGSTQEATAVLVAVNYFQDKGGMVVTAVENGGEKVEDGEEGHTIVAEAGMFPFEALSSPLPSDPIGSALLMDWVRDGSLPLMGASPDGMLRHPNGTCEVLEVKCHSPFIEQRYNNYNTSNSSSYNRDNRDKNKEGLSISDRGPADSVATWHIPQLQLHILCAGPTCTGAVLVSLSATKGATIFRVRRDDKYILEMMSWIRKFYVTYVRASPTRKNSIPENYFMNSPGYQLFLNATLKICAESTVVANVDNEDVQRSPTNTNFFI